MKKTIEDKVEDIFNKIKNSIIKTSFTNMKFSNIFNHLEKYITKLDVSNPKDFKKLQNFKNFILENVSHILDYLLTNSNAKYIKNLMQEFLKGDSVRRIIISSLMNLIGYINDKFCYNWIDNQIKKNIILVVMPSINDIIVEFLDNKDNIIFFRDKLKLVVVNYIKQNFDEEINEKNIEVYKKIMISYLEILNKKIGNKTFDDILYCFKLDEFKTNSVDLNNFKEEIIKILAES